MKPGPKRNQKVQAALGALVQKHGKGRCWICFSVSGMKTSREGYGTRCRRCIEEGRTTPDVEEYERLKGLLGGN